MGRTYGTLCNDSPIRRKAFRSLQENKTMLSKNIYFFKNLKSNFRKITFWLLLLRYIDGRMIFGISDEKIDIPYKKRMAFPNNSFSKVLEQISEKKITCFASSSLVVDGKVIIVITGESA